ncbi:outer membrane protein assembly factor BamD [Rubritalea tangerina]|uniref:Outer membrane protein assembly factor BamD n=1 Tax=Rubritalea tangerina TaxID=430798 RepID=A0ABW4ZBW2_9BACT
MQNAVALSLATITAICVGFTSCSNPNEKIQLASGQVGRANPELTAQLYSQARAYENQGNIKKAIKTYGNLAGDYPMANEAADARIREAELLYSQGELMQAFEKYQYFITQYRGTSQYDKAIVRQAEVAHAASTGQITNSFIGLKSDIPRTKVEKMFIQVRDNAPFGPTAPRAQFGLGEMWERDKNTAKAIKAYEDLYVKYPKSKYAPEALYRVGNLLLNQTEKGNRNRGNLDTANTTFTDLTLLYPNTKQAKSAKQKLKQIAQADVQRSFSIAEFYENKKQYPSAAFYYNEVIRNTKSGSQLHNQAKQRLAAISQ